MENKDKLEQATELLKEWQEENDEHRAVVLCITEEDTGLCGRVIHGTFKNLGLAMYQAYKQEKLVRRIVRLVQAVFKTSGGKEEEDDTDADVSAS